ncbi:hypothetical protein FGIG_01764 [Fasciola gigantica]|uniref:Uncharacterized protein n=1 Tax=Fasciola gigantica TaxID=46835 RepID=A0A504YHI3_FASGI|nr:hypothetical protein FGIG_01764 [Fasciola gigantica]
MDGDTNQTKSRTALFRPAVPTLKTFSPGDDFALWAVRVEKHLQDTSPEHLGQYLLPLLDDDAARQFLATGVPILPGPDIIWPALEELFALYMNILPAASWKTFGAKTTSGGASGRIRGLPESPRYEKQIPEERPKEVP